MLQLHFANRLEALTARLLAQLDADAPADPFDAPQIVVPSAAVQRHLTLAIAARDGVAAHLGFAFLARWLWRQIARVVPAVAAESPFEPEVIAWRVYAAFGDADFTAPHPRLADWLAQADDVMRLDLARRAAGTLEQYVTYRPDWLAAWGDGRTVEPPFDGAAARADEAWQAALWRRLVAELDLAGDPSTAFVDTLAQAGPGGAAALGLPPAVHVFALPAIAPLHLGLLQALGRVIEVHVYVLNPCREYWFEVVDRRRLQHLAAQGRDGLHEEGNHLLAAWGKQTQALVDGLVGAEGDGVESDAVFTEAGGGSLLATVQDAILDLVEPEPGSAGADRSIEVHAAHSLTRQLEALHDQLLALFDETPGLQPADIAVVTPDLEAAAPLIDAVFGTQPDDRRIPYTITGRPRSRANPCARALLDLLALVAGRVPASALHGLLQQPVVARRFGLDADALDFVHDGLQAAGVHWALDAAHRGSFGVPAEARHTLDDGLARLFLGHVRPPGAPPFGGRLAAGDTEGADAERLGRFAQFADAVATLAADTRQPLPAPRWGERLAAALERFVAPDDDAPDLLREVRDAVTAVVDGLRRAGLAELPLPLPVLRSALERALDDPPRGGVPTGQLTFSAIGSLRTLPYRVVCAVGLDDGAFPGPAREAEFDLINRRPRRGDRQRRLDERNLFLDLLLAARERLILCHTGRSVRDNAPLPPSVLVAELLDTLAPVIADDPDDPRALAEARRALVVEHPLQAFSPRLFRADADPRLRSFHHEYADALRRRAPLAAAAQQAAADDAMDVDDDAAPSLPAAPLFTAPLPPPEAAWREVSIAQLVEFFRHPARYLLRRRLGIELPQAADELQDDEPFVADRAAQRALAARLLPPLLAGTPIDALRALAEAGTEYPPGALGDAQRTAEMGRLQRFADGLRAATARAPLPAHHVSLAVELDGQRWQLHGSFAELRADGLARWRYADVYPTDRLEAWLPHLLLNAQPAAGAARTTRWWSRDGGFTLQPVADAAGVLRTLLGLYAQGLRAPLHFYPRTAWLRATEAAPSAVLGAWRPTPRTPHAEGADPAWRLALRGVAEPLDAAFEQLAVEVYAPLIAHLAEGMPDGGAA